MILRRIEGAFGAREHRALSRLRNPAWRGFAACALPFCFAALVGHSVAAQEQAGSEQAGSEQAEAEPQAGPEPRRTDLAADDTVDFARQVQPILAKACYACHGPDKAEGGVRFSDQKSAMSEADSGDFSIVPGDLDASGLIARVTSDDESERMPPEGDPLTAEEIEIVTRWIKQGAPWSKHWAFEPMQHREPPPVDDEDWNKNSIDAYIFASLAAANLKPSPPASRAVLIRRAYYDLTGLPATADQVRDFVSDTDPSAFEKLVDRLLESPHYGERWGRHWLDLVRYAETNSYERDGVKPNAYKYRDYVIKSLNDDKPYDQFIREQLAGDELDVVTTETLTGTGYYRLGVWDDEPADPLQAHFDGMDDIIMTTGQAFLGLTMNCARCHDHKIDPVPQTDYYSLLAFLADVTPWGTRGDQSSNNQVDVSPAKVKQQYLANDQQKRSIEAAIHQIEQSAIVKMSAPDQRATEGPKKDRKRVLKEHLKSNLSDDQWIRYRELKQELDAVTKRGRELPRREMVMGLARCTPRPKPTHLLFRGNPHSPTDEVRPAFPSLFAAAAPEIPEASDGDRSAGRRRVLADWIASKDNRLTARVMANRIWQFHFGRGIVRSSNNFGQLGTPPTHPELLDWLAQRLIDGGWKLKTMHRLIMNSKSYQMASSGRDDGKAIDPDNDLFWRFNPRRLSAEEVRDSVLAVNGSLNPQLYGASFFPTLSPEVLAGQSRPGAGWGKSTPRSQNRRSIYIHVKRSLLTPLLSAFDFPDPDLTCEDRFATLQPGQALSLLNSDFIHQQAKRLVTSIKVYDSDNEQVVRNTVLAVLSREATDKEIHDGAMLIRQLETKHGVARSRAVQLYCMSVMNWNEFMFVD